MKITFLGTSHGVPAADRYCSSTMIDVNGCLYFIDAGAPLIDLLLRRGADLNQVKAVFTTHLHDLAASVDAINERVAPLGGSRLDTLVAGIEKGERSFLILRQKPDGKSYAGDIAAKYGLSLENILQNRKG